MKKSTVLSVGVVVGFVSHKIVQSLINNRIDNSEASHQILDDFNSSDINGAIEAYLDALEIKEKTHLKLMDKIALDKAMKYMQDNLSKRFLNINARISKLTHKYHSALDQQVAEDELNELISWRDKYPVLDIYFMVEFLALENTLELLKESFETQQRLLSKELENKLENADIINMFDEVVEVDHKEF